MTKQEFYDKNIEAARSGVFPSFDPFFSRCVYRMTDENGKERRCSAGLTLEPYDLVTEGQGVGGFMWNNQRVNSANTLLFERRLPAGMTIGDLASCQQVHDRLAGRHSDSWDTDITELFVRRFNELSCFADVIKVTP